jgi:hypothetical protein
MMYKEVGALTIHLISHIDLNKHVTVYVSTYLNKCINLLIKYKHLTVQECVNPVIETNCGERDFYILICLLQISI